MARSIDEVDNTTGLYVLGGDGTPDYQYYVDRGGTLDLCDISGGNTYFEEMPGNYHERWFGFTNAPGASKLVCVASDGRLLDGDVYASRPMLQLQPYTKSDGTKSAWALLAYEESKGLGHSLAAEEHEDQLAGGQAEPDRQHGDGEGHPEQPAPQSSEVLLERFLHGVELGAQKARVLFHEPSYSTFDALQEEHVAVLFDLVRPDRLSAQETAKVRHVFFAAAHEPGAATREGDLRA